MSLGSDLRALINLKNAATKAEADSRQAARQQEVNSYKDRLGTLLKEALASNQSAIHFLLDPEGYENKVMNLSQDGQDQPLKFTCPAYLNLVAFLNQEELIWACTPSRLTPINAWYITIFIK